jgi:integrase
MPRIPKPFLVGRNWYSDVGGTRTLLAEGKSSEKQAKEELRKLLDRRERARLCKARRPELTVGELIDLYLDDVQANRSKMAYNRARWRLRHFRAGRAKRPALSISRADVLELRNSLLKRYKPNSVRDVLGAVARVYTWASSDAELLPEHRPTRGVKKPAIEHRSRVMTAAEHARLLEACTSADLRDFLQVLRTTGARPGELRGLRWHEIDWTRRLFILRKHKTSTTTKEPLPRIIPFNTEVEAILHRRQKQTSSAHAFTNSCGRSWTARALAKAFWSTRQRAGLGPDEAGEVLVAYSARHTLLTAAARSGASSAQLQALAGWSSPAMASVYVHLTADDIVKVASKAVEALDKKSEKE